MQYIHYGHTSFDRDKFDKPRNRRVFTKPEGGFWASPVDAKFGWKQWCEEENFRDCRKDNSFTFTLSETAKVITIRTVEEAKELPRVKDEFSPDSWITPDFEKLVADGWDAVELVLSSDWRLYNFLYGWDCDSIVILNPDVMILD
jgi:hypothetical protein